MKNQSAWLMTVSWTVGLALLCGVYNLNLLHRSGSKADLLIGIFFRYDRDALLRYAYQRANCRSAGALQSVSDGLRGRSNNFDV
jgi:hypothetical protein